MRDHQQTTKPCPLCGTLSRQALAIGSGGGCRLFPCANCGVQFAGHVARSGEVGYGDHFQGLNLHLYEQSVQRTRERSYVRLLRHVKRHLCTGRWLDVGCSYGWLLKRVQQEGFVGYGVEPSASAAARAREDGLDVAEGVFPEEPGRNPPYSIVSFMDVLEHLPNPVEVLQKARAVMTPDGLLVIQVPDQRCLLYQSARFLARAAGADFALQRLWLVNFSFPHLFYFNQGSLCRLLRRTGFEVLEFYRAPIGSPGQAFSRVNYVEEKSGPLSIIVAGGVAALNLVDNLSGHGGLMVLVAGQRKER